MSDLTVKVLHDLAQVRADAAIDPSDINGSILTQSSMLVHYQAIAAQARRQHELFKSYADVFEAKLYLQHRTELLKDGGKATEKQIEAAVHSDPKWLAIQKAVIDAREQQELTSGAVDMFRDRHGLLLSEATDRRKEREGELRVGAAKSVADELRQSVLTSLNKNKAA